MKKRRKFLRREREKRREFSAAIICICNRAQRKSWSQMQKINDAAYYTTGNNNIHTFSVVRGDGFSSFFFCSLKGKIKMPNLKFALRYFLRTRSRTKNTLPRTWVRSNTLEKFSSSFIRQFDRMNLWTVQFHLVSPPPGPGESFNWNISLKYFIKFFKNFKNFNWNFLKYFKYFEIFEIFDPRELKFAQS